MLKNGFDSDFIVGAKIKVQIPDNNIYARTLYCYPELIDKDGRHYAPGRIIETAYEQKFDPFEQRTFARSLLEKIKKIFKPSHKSS